MTPNSPESLIPDFEELLVQRLRDLDESAMTLFYDKYSAALYGVILRIVKTEEVAEDVLQEGLVKIWQSFRPTMPPKAVYSRGCSMFVGI